MTTDHVTAWIEGRPADQREILVKLREWVLAAAPDVIEAFKWSRPVYARPRGSFAYLYAAKNHVTLGFDQGALLDDPNGLLEGTGKAMRHIKVKALDELDEGAVKALLEEAVERGN